MNIIFITHCSAKKDESWRASGTKVTPDKLYTAQPLQRFVNKCKEKGKDWAIFSDKYGVLFPEDKIEWYEKNPNSVSEIEYDQLLKNFMNQLSEFNEIWFYYNPGRFHSLYKRLVRDAKTRGVRIHKFTHLYEIE